MQMLQIQIDVLGFVWLLHMVLEMFHSCSACHDGICCGKKHHFGHKDKTFICTEITSARYS